MSNFLSLVVEAVEAEEEVQAVVQVGTGHLLLVNRLVVAHQPNLR
jgi:hypothetical protein